MSYPAVGQIRQIHYNAKKYPGMEFQNRHCRVIAVAAKRPFNCLVILKGGARIVVPMGNLFDKFRFGRR
jgi:hypothetical protein